MAFSRPLVALLTILHGIFGAIFGCIVSTAVAQCAAIVNMVFAIIKVGIKAILLLIKLPVWIFLLFKIVANYLVDLAAGIIVGLLLPHEHLRDNSVVDTLRNMLEHPADSVSDPLSI
jgi:hypothetical protein